jgi:ClpP class serine protease
MTIWLLERTAALDFERARAKHVFTGDQLMAFDRVVAAASAASNSIARIAGNVCEIPIAGVLTKARDRLAWILGMGNTTYADIRNALAQAESDPSIKSIVLRVDSPGGMVDGLFETIDAIAACTKPVVAVCDLAASAAYGLASAAKRIEASGRASSFGSIGVATSYSYWNDEELIELTNTDSPNKRPDARTDAGKKVIIEQLDAIAALLMESIARGRSTTAAVIKSTYGRGAMLLAGAAKQAGMIDSVRNSSTSTTRASATGDRGDAIVALLDGKPLLPQPGESQLAFVRRVSIPLMRGEPPEANGGASPSHDRGDAIVALLDARRDRRAPAPTPVPATPGASSWPPESRDYADKVVELHLARKEGRAPAAWAADSGSTEADHTDDIGDRIVALVDGDDPEGEAADHYIAQMERLTRRTRALAR